VRRSRKILFGLIVLVALAVSVSIAGAAKPSGFHDDFTTLDTSRWLVISRPFGHGTLDLANVAVADGQLGVTLPANTTNGGEMRTRSLFKYGTYRTSLKVANAPSSLTAFFMYRAPDYDQELDIEIFDDSSGTVWFSTYSGGAQTQTVQANLGFDPTAAFHVYAIDYRVDSVRFLVDGKVLQTWTSGVPRSSMYLYLNAWFPSWLPGQAPSTDRYTRADWIEFTG